MDVSTHIVNQGNTFNIGGSSSPSIHYGPSIYLNTQIEQRRPELLIPDIYRSHNAEYNMTRNVTRGPCTENTRTVLLQTLETWLKTSTRLFWLNGIAGTGKTTVVYSFSQLMSSHERLGASFFCSRSLQDCRDINRIIPTMAYQLAKRYSQFQESLAKSLERDTDIFTRSLDAQLCGRIIEPWNSIAESLPVDMVVVLDALDECDGGHSTFLQVLFNNITRLPFKTLITSRPDYSIRETMKAMDVSILSTFILHDIEQDVVEADIAKYLEYQLSGRVSLISSKNYSYFRDHSSLLPLLWPSSLPWLPKKALASLDELYHGVLHSSLYGEELWDEEVQDIKAVLYMIVCARDPLTRESLAGILGIAETEVDRRLDSLHSVLSIPEDRDRPIIILHASFADFMQDQARSGPFYCHPTTFHLEIARYCLAILDGDLRRNLEQISPSLRYAAIYWEHLILSDQASRQIFLGDVYDFLARHALHWIECLARQRRLATVIQNLESLLSIPDESTLLVTVAYEVLRLVQYYYDDIIYNTWAIYWFIMFIPASSPLRTLNIDLFQKSPQARNEDRVPEHWPPLERVINIHSDYTNTIAISQDGNWIASGSNDTTVRIWNIRRHTEECVLTGHTKWVNSVAITPNGSCVISGSDDRTVRVWETTTNKATMVLEAPGVVLAVAISSEENKIAGGDWKGRICIWDATNGALIHLLEGHTRYVRSLSFILGATHLVSASQDQTARVWNTLTGETKSILRGHTGYVYCVACSPAGDRIVTASQDRTARLWDISGQELRILRGHSNEINTVAFVPNGKQVITGSSDETLRIWDADTGYTMHIIAQTGPVQSMAVFPDGLKIATTSERRIKIWSMRDIGSRTITRKKSDALPPLIKGEYAVLSPNRWGLLFLPSLQILDKTTLKQKAVLRSLNGCHDCGAWSASGRRVAIAGNKEIEVWRLRSGDIIVGKPLTFQGHNDKIYSVSLSYDDRYLVSASADRSARIWNTTTGQQIHMLRHPDSVRGASFSHDNNRVVSHSSTHVHLWNTQTGEQLYQFDADSVNSVIFTPNDQHFIIYNKREQFGLMKALTPSTVTIRDAQTYELVCGYPGYDYWTTLDDGVSYALDSDGWVYRATRFNDLPQRLIWVPFQYRPNIPVPKDSLFSASPDGIELYLPRTDGPITVIIPNEY